MMKTPSALACLPKILVEEDKIKHMAWSFWLLMAGMFFMPPTIALLVVFLIGLGKEVWDKYYGSGFCYYDMLGNFIGMALALMVGALLGYFQAW